MSFKSVRILEDDYLPVCLCGVCCFLNLLRVVHHCLGIAEGVASENTLLIQRMKDFPYVYPSHIQ